MEKNLLEDIENEIAIRKLIEEDQNASQVETIDISEEVDLDSALSKNETQKLPERIQTIFSDDSESIDDYNLNLMQETRKLIMEKHNVDRLTKTIDNQIIMEAKVVLYYKRCLLF